MNGSDSRIRLSRGLKRGWCVSLVALCAATAVGTAGGQPLASAPGALADAPGPVGGVPDKLPDLKMPSADQLRLVVPRPVQAATAALGLGRQRLALVMGIGTLGSRQVLDSAPRDSLAVATALRSAGFVVMVREDATSTDLRAALKEFHERLQPGGMGLLYVTALGAHVDGRNLLVPRDALLDAASPAATVADGLRTKGVPVQELVDALMGTAESTRMLVVDAAYKHPALDKLPQRGLGAQALPPGMIALFAQSPLVVQEVPAVAPLPTPVPSDPQLLAASPFARLLVRSVLTPKLSGAEVLRSTHRALVDSTQGAVTPWIAGDTDAKEEMAELTLLDAVLPTTPEEYAREGVKRAVAQMTKPGAARASEPPVSDLLQQTQAPTPTTPPGTSSTPSAPADGTRTSLPELPANTSALGSAANALGTAASVAGSAASVAGTVATVAVGLKAAQAVAAANVASTAVEAATSVAGNAVALATRLGSGGSGESGARQAVSAAAAAPAASLIPISSAAPAAPAAAATRTASAATAAPRNLAGSAAELSVAQILQSATPAPGRAPTAQTAQPSDRSGRAGPAANQPPATDARTTRNPQGGERPVYTPRSNSYGYAEGDTFSYQVTDTWKGEVTGRYTTAIEEVLDNGQMLANSQQVALDAQGRLKSLRSIDGGVQRFEPHQDLWWSKPTPGQSRDVDFKEIFERADKTRGETQFKGSSSVGKLQKIETPAGEFEALPIETSGWYHEKLANGTLTSGKFERTVWYSPQLGHPVAIDIKDVDRLGKLLKRERVELTHAQQVRGAP